MYQEMKDEKKIDVSKFFGFKSIMIYILSILIGISKLSSGATPFGLALLGAIVDTGFPLIIPLILIGTMTGIAFGWTCLLKFMISSVIFIVLRSFIKGNTKVGIAAKILFSTAISEIIILLMSDTLIYDAVMAAFMSATTAIFYLIFTEGLPVILDFKNRKIDSHETLMASGILCAVALSSIGEFSIFGLSIRGILCVLIVLLLGWKRGATCGIIAGVSISLVLGIMGIADASTVATYAICGLLSGLFSRFGKIGAIIGFIIGNAVWVFYINASTDVIIPIDEILIASIVLFFMPKRVSTFIDDIFDFENALEGNDPVGFLAESTIYKLKAVSDVAKDMANNVGKEEIIAQDRVGVLIKNLKENTCKKCSNYKKCWGENYHVTYETIFNAIQLFEMKDHLVVQDVDTRICENKISLIEGLNYSYELYKLDKDWKDKVQENKKLVAKQLMGVSKAIDTVQNEILLEDSENENLLGAGYRLELGISKAKKNDSKISGDTIEYTKLKNGKILIGISDGMGSGENASNSSKKVLELLEKYLNTGLEKNVALDLINSYMMLGENRENYSTLDVVIFNPFDSSFDIIKFGACPTYILQDGTVKMLTSKSLPVGAMINANAETYSGKFDRGSYIVMISDGILESNDLKERWIKDLLKSIKSSSSQRIADIILQEALDMNYGMAKDDMSVIVAKVC